MMSLLAISFLVPPALFTLGLPQDVAINSDVANEHFTLFAPIRSTHVFLIDESGQIAHEWETGFQPGHEARLMPDGRLFHTGKTKHELFRGGGQGGRLSILEADGTVAWSWTLPAKYLQHHDVELLPNGNMLAIAWEQRTAKQAEALGREPDSVSRDGIWPDVILEIRPVKGETGAYPTKDSGKIVWEWHSWDHLVQDRDENKANYGVIADSPRRIDINHGGIDKRSEAEIEEEEELLRALGYLGDDDEEEEPPKPKNRPPGLPDHIGRGNNLGTDNGPATGGRFQADWMHANALSYNPELDLIALSLRHFSEVIVIDHSTTSKEAASASGGKHGHGGDILWRWGNPQNYGQGGDQERTLFGQHDVRWILTEYPGAGAITVFNNGEKNGRPWSTIEQIRPDFETHKGVFGPLESEWSYQAEDKNSFFSSHISGAVRLKNGNTLITSGEQQWIFEIDAAGATVWEHRPDNELMTRGEEKAPRIGRGPGGRGQGPLPRPRAGRKPPPGGPGGGSGLFRSYRYLPDHPGILALFTDR